MINQILEMPSEGATVDGEMAHPVIEGTVLHGSRSLRVLRERSSRASDPRLIFDSVNTWLTGILNGTRSGSTTMSLFYSRVVGVAYGQRRSYGLDSFSEKIAVGTSRPQTLI